MGELALLLQARATSAPSLAWLTIVSVAAPLALMIILIGLAVVKGPRPRQDATERDEPPSA